METEDDEAASPTAILASAAHNKGTSDAIVLAITLW